MSFRAMEPAFVLCLHFTGALLAFQQLTAASPRFAGVPISPGETVQADVPLSAAERSYAADASRNVPATAVAVIAVPPHFDPTKIWPVLVIFSTSDFKRLNRDDLIDFYRSAALQEGWIVLAGDGHGFAPNDTNGWRAAMTLAALDALHRSFPGSDRWPVAIAGFSGGAKRASLLAPLLVVKGCRLCGIYLSGVNQDELSLSYRKSHLGKEFLQTPIFISSGSNDSVAPPDRARSVADSIKSAGFRSVRLVTFSGGHAVKNAHTIEALRWFWAGHKP
jgi:pimeloyl-ACP methyl ester carboxylesterase